MARPLGSTVKNRYGNFRHQFSHFSAGVGEGKGILISHNYLGNVMGEQEHVFIDFGNIERKQDMAFLLMERMGPKSQK